jgi:predicted esterase/LysM repeat protein
LRLFFGFVPLLVILLFFGALFWAKGQDPFSRKWFTLKTADHGAVKCVAVLPKPMRQYPVIVFAHGSGGSLMNDGNDLRQMAELGLTAVSLEYNQTNEAAFAAQFETLLRFLGRQKWANTNAMAWVGFSLGANRMFDFALHHPEQQPQLLVQMSGAGIQLSTLTHQPTTNFHCPMLLVHGERDEIFPVADTKLLASILQTNGTPAELKIIPGVPHSMEPERGVVFRAVGEYCLTQLAGKDARRNYHSIAQWQAEAPPLWLFLLPAAVVAAGVLACRRAGASRPADTTQECRTAIEKFLGLLKFGRGFRAAGRAPSTSGGTPDATLKRHEIVLRWVAVILATLALAVTAIHLVPPQFQVSDTTEAIARKFLLQPKEQADFEYLASQPIWQGQKLKTLLTHVELAGYNRELINWQLDEKNYSDYVLSPIIELSTLPPLPTSGETSNIQHSTFNAQPSTCLDWRRPLWEEFYPRIRHENSPEDAARIVVRHLRERVTISDLPNLPHDVPAIWLRQITDETGFEMAYVAALRSVGVPARLNAQQQAEFWDGTKWVNAPRPAVVSW